MVVEDPRARGASRAAGDRRCRLSVGDDADQLLLSQPLATAVGFVTYCFLPESRSRPTNTQLPRAFAYGAAPANKIANKRAAMACSQGHHIDPRPAISRLDQHHLDVL